MHDTKTIVLFFVFKSVSDDIFIRMILKFYPRGVNKYANASIKHVQIPFQDIKRARSKSPKKTIFFCLSILEEQASPSRTVGS